MPKLVFCPFDNGKREYSLRVYFQYNHGSKLFSSCESFKYCFDVKVKSENIAQMLCKRCSLPNFMNRKLL